MSAQVHRFHHRVAVYVGTGQTVYLLIEEARALANALDACALDIEARGFTDSQFKTVEIAIENS